jgi:hypothetical protein
MRASHSNEATWIGRKNRSQNIFAKSSIFLHFTIPPANYKDKKLKCDFSSYSLRNGIFIFIVISPSLNLV